MPLKNTHRNVSLNWISNSFLKIHGNLNVIARFWHCVSYTSDGSVVSEINAAGNISEEPVERSFQMPSENILNQTVTNS